MQQKIKLKNVMRILSLNLTFHPTKKTSPHMATTTWHRVIKMYKNNWQDTGETFSLSSHFLSVQECEFSVAISRKAIFNCSWNVGFN